MQFLLKIKSFKIRTNLPSDVHCQILLNNSCSFWVELGPNIKMQLTTEHSFTVFYFFLS